MNRKDFIKACGFVCIGGTTFSTALQSCAVTNYFAQTTVSNNQLILKKYEFISVENDKTTKRKYVLVKIDKYNYPICIYNLNDENYSALLMECTHKGCELNPQADYLVCPCHGSEFTNTGIVQNPPADQNLKTFTITTDNENIYILI